jgi:hypothetical protein
MNNEKVNADKDKPNEMPQSPLEETSKNTDENQPISPPEESSPKERKRRMSGARILRDMVGGSLGIRRWPEIREKLNEIEDILEDEYLKENEEGK